MTKFFCTYCGQKLSAKPSMLGTFLTCPVCKNSIEVPDFHKPQVNRFATIPLSAPAPPARPGEAPAAPATPAAILPKPIAEEPPPPAPAATLPPAAPIPAPAAPAAALPLAVPEPVAVETPSPPATPVAVLPAPEPAVAPILPPAAPAAAWVPASPEPAAVEIPSPPAAPLAAAPFSASSPPPLPSSFLSPMVASPPSLQPAPAYHQPAPPTWPRKNPTLATILAVFPGFGQIYNGQIIIGLILFPLTLILYPCFLLGLVLHIYLVFDARNEAHKINARSPEEHARITAAKHATFSRRNIAIASAVILAFIGLIVWRVTAAEKQNPASTGPVHFSTDRDGWVSGEFHRLQLKLPSTPYQVPDLPAGEVAELLEGGTWDRRQIVSGGCHFDIVHGTFKGPANLQGAIDRSIMTVARLPSVSRMKTNPGETTISGRQAASLEMSFHLEDELQNLNTLIIIEDREIWHINLLGPPKEVASYWPRIRESVRFEQPK